MIPDALYDLAFAFRKTKLWDRLYDTQLFAVGHSDGSVGYCSVMGRMREHLALGVYPGLPGLEAYRRMGMSRRDMDSFEEREMALSQDCVMVSFENKSELHPREHKEAAAYCAGRGITLRGRKAYPQFQRFRPHYIPWTIHDPADQLYLQEGLEACLEVSARLKDAEPEALGFTEGAPFDRSIPLLEKKDGGFQWSVVRLPEPRAVAYPAGEIGDEITLARLGKAPKGSGEWACHVFMHIDPMSDEAGAGEAAKEPESAPFYPYVLMIVDNPTGLVKGVQLAEDPEDYTLAFTRFIVETALKRGKPSRILVRDQRTHALFSKLAAPLGAKLTRKAFIQSLEEALEGFWEHFGPEEELDGLEEMDEPDEEALMVEALELLRSPLALRELPREMIAQLMEMARAGELPDDIGKNVRREGIRRGMR